MQTSCSMTNALDLIKQWYQWALCLSTVTIRLADEDGVKWPSDGNMVTL